MNASRFRTGLALVTLVGFAYLVYDYVAGRLDPAMPLSGSISIGGKPMTKGIVRFISLDPNLPFAFGGHVKDGRYEVPVEFGITPARYQVEFSSIGPDDVQDMISASDAGVPSGIQEEVPAQFNQNSEIQVDLSSGSVLRADFDLK